MLLCAAYITVLWAVIVTVAGESRGQEKSVEENPFTSIRLRKDTVEKLKERGRKGESYDDIVKRLLEKRRR